MPSGPIKTIAILGAGKLGTVIARLATTAGYTVYIAGSGNPDKIKLSMQYIAPSAISTFASEAIAQSDAVILALPLSKYRQLSATDLRGKLVIDAMNYWWEVDGNDPEFAQPRTSSSEVIQKFLKDSRVVKALSHMGYHHLFDETRPHGDARRKAIAIAGGSSEDIVAVSQLVDDLGFDPVAIGPLANGKILEPGHELFGSNMNCNELRAIVAKSL